MLYTLQSDSVTKVFRLNDDTYRRLMVVLNAEMDRGLQRTTHNEATVKMFHTYVRSLPTGAGQQTIVCTVVSTLGYMGVNDGSVC